MEIDIIKEKYCKGEGRMKAKKIFVIVLLASMIMSTSSVNAADVGEGISDEISEETLTEDFNEQSDDNQNEIQENPEDSTSESELLMEGDTSDSDEIMNDDDVSEIPEFSSETEDELADEVEDYIATGTCGENITWTLDKNYVLRIKGTGTVWGSGTENHKIWRSARELIIEDGITGIGAYAFQHYPDLTNVIIADSVTEYGYGAFQECPSLKKAVLSKNAETISENMFYGCSELEEVIIPEGVKYIETCAFWNTYKCKVTIPNSMIEMNDYPWGSRILPCRFAFDEYGEFSPSENETYYHEGGSDDYDDYDEENCSVCIRTGTCGTDATYKLTITNKMTISGRGTVYIYNNNDLTALTVEEGIYHLDSDFWNGKLETVKLADSVKSIKEFSGCSKLKSVVLGKNLKADLAKDFERDISLENITISDENPYYTVKDGVVFNKDMTELILYPQNKPGEVYEIPKSVTTIDPNAFCYNQNLKKIIIPETIKITDEEHQFLRFNNCKSLETIVFKGEITEISSGFMENCPSLTEITIPDGVTEIGYEAFSGCENLQQVTVPEGVTRISGSAFLNCKGMRKITLPKSLVAVRESAFNGCSQLMEVRYLGTVEDWKQIEIEDRNEYLTETSLHSYECVEEVLPDCENKGRRVYKCNKCDDSFTVELPAKGHTTVEIPAVKPTCEKVGMTEGSKCSVCGKIFIAQETIPATGHKFGTWKTISQATVFSPKKQKRNCSVCRKSEEKNVGNKLQKTMKVSVSSITLKTRQKTTALKVTGLAKGDSIVSWKSSNTNIAKISGNKIGRSTVTAGTKTGKTKLTITLKSGLKKSVNVSVQKGTVKTSKISGVEKNLKIKVKQNIKLCPVISPVTSQEKVTYTSSNKKIATVTSGGVIKGLKKGTATITIRSGSKKTTCKVTVK